MSHVFTDTLIFYLNAFADTDGLVSQALLVGNFEGAVDLCFKADRMAEALILAVAGGPELFARTQKRYLDQARSSISKVNLLTYVCLPMSLTVNDYFVECT